LSSVNPCLPPPLMTSEHGSFARTTIIDRKPQIIRQVIEDNNFPDDVILALKVLNEEILCHPMQPLREKSEDTTFWNEELQRCEGSSWLDAPWYFAEAFFYRRLMEATQYFQPGMLKGIDPFLKQKQRSMDEGIEWFVKEWEYFNCQNSECAFEALLHSCLWGNRADLSNDRIYETMRSGINVRNERHMILIDHSKEVLDLLQNGVKRVDFFNDNVGKELFYDLAFVDFLLAEGWVGQIILHLKEYPFFVSDAMPKDVTKSIRQLRTSGLRLTKQLGERLENYLRVGKLKLAHESFWTTCLMFRQMPINLREDLAKSALVLVKGDVNYRRILDDRHWPYTTPLTDIAGYFPTSFVALRTLKGEILAGLNEGMAEEIQKEDPNWLIDGKRGIIQLFKR